MREPKQFCLKGESLKLLFFSKSSWMNFIILDPNVGFWHFNYKETIPEPYNMKRNAISLSKMLLPAHFAKFTASFKLNSISLQQMKWILQKRNCMHGFRNILIILCFLYICMRVCMCGCQEWHACNLQFNKYIFSPHRKIPSSVLGNKKRLLQQYNEAMFIKTGYVGNTFLLPHYSIHLTKIQTTLWIHLIFCLYSPSPLLLLSYHIYNTFGQVYFRIKPNQSADPLSFFFLPFSSHKSFSQALTD